MRKICVMGIVGNHGSGKSTLVRRLAKDIPILEPEVTTHQQSFADPIREKLSSILPYQMTKHKQHPYEREALVLIGEAWRRQDLNYFVNLYITRLSKFNDLFMPVVVLTDDVYHWNEHDICDIHIYLRNKQYQPPTNYVPVSVKQTLSMLDKAEHGGYQNYYSIEHVEELDQHYPKILNQIINGVRKVLKLGGLTHA